MQWLHFVNELDCYKGKENKKQLLNIIQLLCSHNVVTLKDIRCSIKKIIITILTTLFTGWGPLDPNPHFLKTGGPIKNQSYMPEKYLQNKEFTWVSRFFLFRSSCKIFKKKVLGIQRTSPPVNKGLIDLSF